MLFDKKIRSYIFLFLVPFIVISIWFRNKLILGGGEAGIPFYNLISLVNIYNSTWANKVLGNFTGWVIANIPFFWFFSLFEKIKLPAFLIQAILFTFIFLFAGLGLYLLVRDKFEHKVIVFSSTLFYWFNLFVLFNVWFRFQYPYMFFYALLPLGFFLFLKGIEERKFHYVLLLNLVGLIFAMALSVIPLLELFWLILGSYLLFFTIVYWQDKRKVIFGWTFLFLSIGVWLIFNAWWLLQFIKVLFTSSYITSQAYTVGSNIGTFIALSNMLGNLSYVFRLMHSFFLTNMKEVWGPIYFTPPLVILSYVIPFLAFFPLLLKKKPKILYYFLGLSLILVFLMKGSADPFGGIFLFLFSHLRFLEAFRNPFEKLGLALPFAYAPLVGYSLFTIFNWLKAKWGNVKATTSLFIALCLLFIVLVFPIWNGWVFTSGVPPTNNLKIGDYVKVPTYYKQANNWLNKQGDDFRVIALPIGGEGINYNWEYGYNGVELSNTLFDKPFISLSTTIQFLDTIANQIQYTLFRRSQDFTKMMSVLNAKFLMARSDINYRILNMTNPEMINNYLSTISGTLIPDLKYKKTFGKLTFYENDSFLPKIYPAKNIYFAPQHMMYTDIFSLTEFKNQDAIINESNNQTLDTFSRRNAKTQLIEPVTIIDYSSYPVVSLSDAQRQLPYVRFLPGSKFYPLIRLKEDITTALLSDNQDKFFNLLLFSDKRLAELQRIVDLGSTSLIPQASKDYISSLEALNGFIKTKGYSEVRNNLYYFRFTIISEKMVLQDLLKKYKANIDLQKAYDAVLNFSVDNNIIPLFKPIEREGFSHSRIIYRFDVPKAGNFDIVLKWDNFQAYYLPLVKEMPVQIDNSIILVSPTLSKDWLDFGNFFLTKGSHEVQIELPSALNALNSKNQEISFVLNSNKYDKTVKSFPFMSFDPYGKYRISFDYWLQRGNAAKVEVTTDVDRMENGKNIPLWSRDLSSDSYNNYYQNRIFTITPNPNAIAQTLSFIIKPFNNCKEINALNILGRMQCENNRNFYNSFNKPTTLLIRNLRVERVFNNPLILRYENPNYTSLNSLPKITFQTINPAKYVVHVKDAKKPYFLIFTESYHPLWQAEFSDTKKAITQVNHFLVDSYANTWYITRSGNYDLTLEFSAEKDFELGKKVSLIGIFLSLLFLAGAGTYKRRKHG